MKTKSKEIFCYYIEDNKLEEYFFKGKEKEFLNFISAEAKNKNQVINCYKIKNGQLHPPKGGCLSKNI